MLKEKRSDVNARLYSKSLNNIKLPKKEKNIFLVEFDGQTQLDIVLKIASIDKIEFLDIVSFRLPLKAIYLLEDAKKRGMIKVINYYLSDSILKMVQSTYNYLKGKNVVYDNFHSKMSFVKTKENNYIIQSTGNFHFEKDIEATTIHNSEKMYNDLQEWLKNI